MIQTDYLVVGAGVAGLRAAIELSKYGEVLVAAKDSLKESSSEYAQGGIAVALSDDDEISLHAADTLVAGDGLCNEEAVNTLVSDGPPAIRELIAWGTRFDQHDGRLAFAREGAHSRSRVLHSHGDSTGREIARALYEKAVGCPAITFQSFAAVVDLLQQDGRVVGALVLDEQAGELRPVVARATLLATGGLGRVYTDTTNPDVATGDGVAMAWRAGAAVRDIEFVQFHPTALHVEGAPRFLLSEALRGEGAVLLNGRGERFMPACHPMAELAPRDVVSRAIVDQLRQGSPVVYLDLSGRGEDFVKRRFPRIHSTCLRCGIDLDKQAAPVLPAAHYAMGGVATDLDGQTTLPGLWAAGEVAATGVHGANRLASNSLLEGVVFGARAARSMRAGQAALPGQVPEWNGLDVPALTLGEVQRVATALCGILRDQAGLELALQQLGAAPPRRTLLPLRGLIERANAHTVVRLIARAALERQESRGAHFRTDYPQHAAGGARHSRLQRNQPEVSFE